MDKKNIPEFSDEEQKKVIELFTFIEEAMNFIKSIPADERKALRKMGDDSMEFIHKCYRASEASIEHFPANFDLGSYKRAIALFEKMQPVVVKKKMLDEKIDDTIMMVKSIMLIFSEDAYGILKRASKQDAAVKKVVDDIGTHYKGRGPKKKKPKAGE